MKKRLLVAAIMAAMTISAVPAFAATPTFSGDSNIEYNKFEDADTLTNRIRLTVDSEVAENLYVHGRVVMNNNLRGASSASSNPEIVLEQAYVGSKIGNVDVKAGRQPLWLGKGTLADVNGINGIQASTSNDSFKLSGFVGSDDRQDVYAADFGTSYQGINFGASYLNKEHQDKFFAVNADTKLTDNAVLNVEYVDAKDADANGYIAEVKFGNAAKKGDIDYAVSYRDIENGAVDAGYSTNGSYNDSKGFRVKANYKVADNALLTAYQDIAEDQLGNDKNRTNVEFSLNF